MLKICLAGLFFHCALASRALAQARVAASFATPPRPAGNVDSCVVWVAPDPEDSLLFVTEKEGDTIEVWRAGTGAAYAPKPVLGGVPDGSGPGELNRPNGVWVLYHVPYASGFTDVLLVTDQQNLRVQVFRLPELEYFGEIGTAQVGKGYGIASYQDGTDFFVFITDNIPPAAWPGKIKKYRLRPEGALLGADLIFGVGSTSGNPPLPNVESIVADLPLNRLHVCGDEGGKLNRIFRLDGSYTGIAYGDPQFEFDQEGINLYDMGGERGYLLVSDQHTDGTPNEFELFDRSTLVPLGNFRSAAGPIVTTNTDGAYFEQRPLPGFPNGAFYAVNDDQNAHAYDWTAIAEAMDLNIVALDRPFPGAALGKNPGAPPGGQDAAPSRAGLWFHDGSWWGAIARGNALTISRLEDGTFARLVAMGPTAPAEAWSSGDDLVVLTAAAAPQVLQFAYEASLRHFAQAGNAVTPGPAKGPLATFAVEPDAAGHAARAWVAWVEEGELHVTWSGPDSGGNGDLSAWNASGVLLGASAGVLPRIVRRNDATAVLWSEPGGVALELHRDVDPPETWSPRESVSSSPVDSLAAAYAPDGRLLVAGATQAGAARLHVRSTDGAWTDLPLSGSAVHPAIVVDGAADRVHLFHLAEVAGRRILQHREASLGGLAFGAPRPGAGWPGVSLDGPVFPSSLSAEAHDLVAACLGDDTFGYFARLDLSRGADLEPPVTFQHTPAPGATGVAQGSRVSFRITDDTAGVDRAALNLIVNGQTVTPVVRGVPRNLLVSHVLAAGLDEPTVHVRIEASDLALPPRAMAPFEYDFFLEGSPGAPFRRGDANNDASVDIADAVRILLGLFAAGPELACLDSGDANDDGKRDTTDAIHLLRYLFLEGSPLPEPHAACGGDPTPDGLDCGAGGCP